MMTDRVGQQLGNYRLLHLLGQGGFADVYLAEHVHLNTRAAVKVLSMRVTNDNMEQFRIEARTLAHLIHPHIVRVLDFGVDNEMPYLAMDYAPNGSLRQRHSRGTRLPLDTVVNYTKQVAEALQYAHDKKLIHRDIKPENMLLDENDKVLLSDFGIALIAQSSRNQSTQDVIGTASYMSPEQIQGKPRLASDQYSLGVVVYEWLSGTRPFEGSLSELWSQHMFASPLPLRERIPTISPAVEHVVMTALAKNPKQRFASILAFATALEQACYGVPSTSVSPSFEPIHQRQPLLAMNPSEVASSVDQARPTVTYLPPSSVSPPLMGNPLPPSKPQPSRPHLLYRTIAAIGLAVLVIASSLIWFLHLHTPATTWYNSHYLYKQSITIDHTQVSGGSNLSNFPVLVSLTDPYLKTAINGGYVQNNNGYDILFTDSNETIKLDHEIEKYVPATGEVRMWVRVPMLSATTDTVIYMYFDNGSVTNSQETRTSVWDNNYAGVWHMADNKADTTVNESTAHSNTGTAQTYTSNKTATGQIGDALNFNGNSDYVTITHNPGLDMTNALTISAWINPSQVTQSVGKNGARGVTLIECNEVGAGDGGYDLGITKDQTVWWWPAPNQDRFSQKTIPLNTWTHIAVTYSNGAVSMYINGVSDTPQPQQSVVAPQTSTNPLKIGAQSWITGYFQGAIDEVQISNSARSAGWITTEYNNQSSPSTFYTLSFLFSR